MNPDDEIKLSTALGAVEREYRRATVKHGPMHGAHEGYAVILEEMDELWDEVKAQHPDMSRIRAEACQVAAMGLRLMVDVCDEVSE